jgi:hypothetical protein
LEEIAHEPASVAMVVGINLPLTLSSLWAALGTRRGPARLGCLVLVALVGIVVLLATVPHAAPWEFALFFLVQIAYLTGTLWLARLVGYRLAWRRRKML